MTDMVNHPPHYTHGPIECVRAIHAALGNRGFLSYLRGTIIKYSWRAEHKGATKEDMAKIGFYSNEAVEVAGALELEDSETKHQTSELRAMRDALEHAAEKAQKDHAEIERLERELGRSQGRSAFGAKTPANKVGEAMQALDRAVEATHGITFAADGEIARQIVDCQNLTQALICRIGRI
jgi:hypothetical protein